MIRRPLLVVGCARALSSGGVVRLHEGSRSLPPMVEVDGRQFGLEKGIVMPPSQEELWDWMWSVGYAQKYDPDPSFGAIWSGAQYLALCLGEEEDVEGKNVVEFGCGVGLCGLAAAKAGAKSVHLVDREPLALHMAMSTASLNGLADVVSAQVADFSTFSSDDDAKDVDLVLASDILYDVDHARKFAEVCSRLVEKSGGQVLIADPLEGRAFGAREAFCTAVGLEVEITPFPPRHNIPEPTVLIKVQ